MPESTVLYVPGKGVLCCPDTEETADLKTFLN